jgi:ArsR family transcriptional regulator, cadmium/lead-responsive transcriptional repressor
VTRREDAEVRAGVVFEALADPTRRAVLRGVAEHGPVTATQLAVELPVTRQAIAKHLGVLREAGLVERSKAGRETRFSATPAPLVEAGRWLTASGEAWDDRLGRLARLASAGGRPRAPRSPEG